MRLRGMAVPHPARCRGTSSVELERALERRFCAAKVTALKLNEADRGEDITGRGGVPSMSKREDRLLGRDEIACFVPPGEGKEPLEFAALNKNRFRLAERGAHRQELAAAEGVACKSDLRCCLFASERHLHPAFIEREACASPAQRNAHYATAPCGAAIASKRG
jgi:hypothetical protein